MHAGGVRRADAVEGVLDHPAGGGLHAEQLRCAEENIRVRFAAGCLIPADHDREILQEARVAQLPRHGGGQGGGSQRRRDPRLPQKAEDLLRARLDREAFARIAALEVPADGGLKVRDREVRAVKLAQNLPRADDRHADEAVVLLHHLGDAALLRGSRPELQCQPLGVENNPVHIENNRKTAHEAPPAG